MATDVADLPEGFTLDSPRVDLAALEDRHGLPKGLLNAIKTAEGSGAQSVSAKGARGVFQFMPATAKAYGLTDPTDEAASADAAARYMRWAKDTYKTDDPRVLSAEFNGGPTAARAVLAGKEPPALETRNYIKKVKASMPSVDDLPAGFTADELPPGFKLDTKPSAPAKRQSNADVSSPFFNPVAEAVGNMASGAVGKFAGDVAGLGAIAAHYMGLTNKLPADVQSTVQDALTYQPRTTAGQNIARYNPLALAGQGWGKIADALGDSAAKPGTPYSPLGAGLAEGIKQLPMFIAGPGVKGAGAAMQGEGFGARGLMRSALKPGVDTLQARTVASDTIGTLLDEGINVSRGGVQTLTDRIGDLNNRITTAIQNSPAMIDRDLVASRLQDTVNKFARQVNPLSDLKSIQTAWQEFQNTWPAQINVQFAQELKQGTYRNLSGKYQGELRSADIEAQKALARGLKEEIANAVPEVRSLNEMESKYLNALPLVERRVLQDANKNKIGLGIISSDPVHLATWMADKSALFKSLVARMLNTAGGAAEALAPVSGAAGAMTNEQQRRP
jgi:hypothetical protein